MDSVSEGIGVFKSDGLKAIFFGGLIAGILDITAASVNAGLSAGKTQLWVFQSVAGGIYGRSTFDGGYKTAALGLLLHFLIATTATAVFYLLSRRIRFLTAQTVLSGVIYGIAVWLFMYLVVLPLTPLPVGYSFRSVTTGVLIHIFCVGLPIALIVRRLTK